MSRIELFVFVLTMFQSCAVDAHRNLFLKKRISLRHGKECLQLILLFNSINQGNYAINFEVF